ncbi:MAG: hypothetical protein HY685_06090, partial [Chloroflexi bacterium]|nr:hypothetical protein [Chloroflexota bacterium]
YVLEPEVVAHIPPGVSCDFGFQLFPDLLAKGVALHGYVTEEFVLDIGSPEAYQRAQQEALVRGTR